MKWFVFVDLPYYPYVGDSVEADTAQEAMRLAVENERPSVGVDLYVAPAEMVLHGRMNGPRRKPEGIIELMDQLNKDHAARIDARMLTGGFKVVVTSGSHEDPPTAA